METKKLGERGSIYVLAIFLIICILALLALFLDGGIGYIGRQQYDTAATQASLAALETYVNSTAVTNEDRLLEARARAEQILSDAIGTNAITGKLVDSGAHSLKFPWETGTGQNGVIRHGTWHFADPPVYDGSTTPPTGFDGCGHGATFQPCFELLSDKTLAGNALQVEPFLSGASLIKTVFANVGIMKAGNTKLATRKGAALIPRLLYFLPDVSPSSVEYSHLSKGHSHVVAGVTLKFSPYYAYPLMSGASCSDPIQSSNVVLGGPRTSFSHLEDTMFHPLVRPGGPGGDNDPTHFYKSDYSCIEITPSQDDCTYAKFYIDTFSGRTPDPLGAILSGMNTSLLKMRARGTLSDRVGMLGFDSGVPLTCRGSLVPNTTSTPPPAEVLGLLNIKNSVDYDKLLDATDLSISPSDPVRAGRMLFPRFINEDGYVVQTDMGLGMQKAEEVITLNYPNFEAARAIQLDIIVYSDGEANCYRSTSATSCPSESASGVDLDNGFPRCCADAGSTNGVPNNIIQGVDEILEKFDDSNDPLILRRVALNMVLFSKSVHKVVRAKGGGGGCMSDAEISAGSLDVTDWTGWQQDPTNTGPPRYWYVNKLWQAVDKSGGYWWVVRPKCTSGSAAANQLALTNACNNSTYGNTANAPVNLTGAFGCQACGSVPNGGTSCPYDPINDPEICQYVDSQGRLMCDIENRTPTTQVIEFINEMTKINPFKPVEVNM